MSGITYIDIKTKDFIFDLSDKIKASGEKFDCILSVARGALSSASYLAYQLEIVPLFVCQINSYDNLNNSGEISIISHIPVADMIALSKRLGKSDLNILIYDSILDQGKTINFMKKFVEESFIGEKDGANFKYKIGVGVNRNQDYKVDFVGKEIFIENAWINFEWESGRD